MSSIICTLLHCSFNFTGISLNLLLIYLLLKKAPKHMRTYSILVLNMACCDLVACLMDFMTQERMIVLEKSIFYISEAPCTLVSSEFCCHCNNTLVLMVTQNVWFLFLSFIYRYSMLGQKEISSSTLMGLICTVYSMSFIQWILFAISPSADREVIQILNKSFPGENFNATPGVAYYGLVDLYNWNNGLGTLSLLGQTTPLLIIEIYILFKVQNYMGDTQLISGTTKSLHKQFFKSLFCQAILPFLTFIGICMFLIPHTGLSNTSFVQYGTFVVLSTRPTLSAFFDLYFIGAFRKEIRSWFGFDAKRRNKKDSLSTTSSNIVRTSLLRVL